MTETLDYQIDNVGGIEHAELHLAPGVNVLRGRNAAGKTSAMRAIVRAQGGGGELERRDGSDHGEVVGPGVRLRVGKVVRATGAAELSLAEVSPLSQLIDPGLKDTDAAARARVRALVELLGISIDDQALEVLCSGNEGLTKWLRDTVQTEAIDDVMAAAERLRHAAHATARTWEARATESEGQATAAARRAEEILEALRQNQATLIDESPESARARLVEGSREYERAVARCESREALERRQAEIRSSIGERPDPSRVERQVARAEQVREDLDARITELERELAKVREERASQVSRVAGLRESLAATESAARTWDEQQTILAQLGTGPTREELEGLRAELVDSAEETLRLAELSERYRSAESERNEAERQQHQAEREGVRLRGIAAAIPDRLGEILADAGAQGITVVGGRLHAVIDGKALDWERRLSEGQRVRAALDVAAQVYRGRVVPLSGIYWTSLDPANRAEFARLAAERGLYVISEEPAEGELRVEHVE